MGGFLSVILLVLLVGLLAWFTVRSQRPTQDPSMTQKPAGATRAQEAGGPTAGADDQDIADLESKETPTPTVEHTRVPAGPIEPDAIPRLAMGSAQPSPGRPLSPLAKSETESLKPPLKSGRQNIESAGRFSVSQRSRRRVPPEKRGGRPRAPEPSAPPRRDLPLSSEDLGPPRADLVCRRESFGWAVGIEVAEPPNSGVDWIPVVDGTRLEGRWGFYRLSSMASSVEIARYSADGDLIELGPQVWPGQQAAGLVAFKLDAQGQQGRRVRLPTSGLCLVLAPGDWERLGGNGPATSEPVFIEGDYRAHYFDLDQEGTRVEFRRPDGAVGRLERLRLDVRLEGPTLPDGSQRMGPFFAPELPVLAADTPEVWDQVGTIVIGREGPGRHRWRTHFCPSSTSCTQLMPPELASMEAGWFFVRLYSKAADLLDSFDFRFASGLRLVKEPDVDPLPGPEGHRQERFILSCAKGWRVRPLQPPQCGVVSPERASDDRSEIQLVIPPLPAADASTWEVTPPSGNPRVPLRIRLSRVWWCIADPGEEPRWSDKPLTAPRAWFGALSEKQLVLKLPRAMAARIGFDQSRARDYRAAGSDGPRVAVHLRDFGESPELVSFSPARLRLWLGRNRSATCLSLPKLTLRCALCGRSSSSEREMMRHINAHLDELFPRLSWEQVLEVFPDRGYPRAIYKCSYHDDHIVIADPTMASGNPVDAIIEHLEHCEYAEREDGKVRVRFESIRDLNRIREIMHCLRGESLPDIRRCSLCPEDSQPFEDPTRESMARHLFECHRDKLWEYREE